MVGQVSRETEVNVPASDAWELFSTLEFAKVVQKGLPDFFIKVDAVEGDGGAGTVLRLTFPPGKLSISSDKTFDISIVLVLSCYKYFMMFVELGSAFR